MRLLVVSLLSVVIASAAMALPHSVEDFNARRSVEACTAQGAAKLWMDSVLVYLSGDTILGTKLLALSMKSKDWTTKSPLLLDAMRLKPHILRSYIKGATPESGYAVNAEAYELNIRDISSQPFPQFPPGKIVRLMLQSGGADAPRRLDLERDASGLYYVRNANALCTGVRPPVTP
jgi:hypothetical protein